MPSERPAPTLRTLIAPLNAALDALWHLSARRLTATVLMAPLLLALALGPALPEAPWNLVRDPTAFGRWLADVQMQWGPWARWLARAGLLSLYATPFFRLLWAIVGFATLVATTDRLLAWRAKEFKGFPWHVLAHVGLLLFLVGALVDECWGWEQQRVLVEGDRPVPAGPVAGALYLQEDGEAGFAGEEGTLRWQQGSLTGTSQMRQGRPLRLGATTVHLLQTGTAVRVRLTDAAGRVLPLDDPASGSTLPEATLCFAAEGESRYVSVPSRDWLVRITRGAQATGGSPFTLWVYRGLDATPLAQAPLTADGEVQVAEIQLQWQVLPYAEVRAAFRPALALWVGGWVLVCLGLLLALVRQVRASRATVAPWGRVLWLAAAVPVALLARLEAGRFVVQDAGRVTRAGGVLLAWAGALLLLAAAIGLLAGRKRRWLAWWREAPGWALLLWMAGGGLLTAASWLAGGTLWQWAPRQVGWALVACLLVGSWHLGRERGRWEPALEAGIAALLAGAVAVIMG